MIDQAVGVIIATRKLTPTAALALLRKQSQNSNIRVAVIAQQLLDRHTQP